MAEIEIHPHPHAGDPFAKRVGLLVGIIGIALTIVTIAAHREHTAAVIHRTEANDAWAYYQAKKTRAHVSDAAAEVLGALGNSGEGSAAARTKLEASRSRYEAEAEKIQKEAAAREAESAAAEHQALRFDLGEGLLELGLVVASLYFLGGQKLFPLAGALSALAGLLTAASVFVA